MRAVVERVKRAEVRVEGRVAGRIDEGLLVLVGIATGDTRECGQALAEKIVNLRLFEGEQGAEPIDQPGRAPRGEGCSARCSRKAAAFSVCPSSLFTGTAEKAGVRATIAPRRPKSRGPSTKLSWNRYASFWDEAAQGWKQVNSRP